MRHKIHLYTRFERLWHWLQALLIGALMITGFELHGSMVLLGYERAHIWHGRCGWSLAVLTVFAIFWHATTGEWKQYLPERKNILRYVEYYLIEIFMGLPHPFTKTRQNKLNPLQRLSYFLLKIFMLPLAIFSGIAYAFSAQALDRAGISLQTTALLHTAGAFALICFSIVHVYMTTTGGTLLQYIRAMITGWEELPGRPDTEENSGR